MFMILILSIMLLLLLGLLWLLLYLLSVKTSLDREKSSLFECGFDPISSRIPFSSHFFFWLQ